MGRGSAEVQVEDRQGTVMRLGFVLAALLASQLALAQTGGSQSAFEAGKLLGQGKNQGAFSGITGGSAQNSIPRYGTSTPEANYFAGGKGETFGPGIGKMQSCATYTPGSDRVANQECEAVNFLARNPNVRPQFNIGQNDPMMQKYRNLRDNAEQAFAQFFPGGRGSSNQCVTRNETIPGQYSTETCVSMQEVGTQQCTIGRVINIDTDANFQCEQTINAYETLKCRRGFSPEFGIQTSTNSYTPSFGSEVPPWSARTFHTSIDIDQAATAIIATLSRYQVDNYGQLWINGTLVYQNVLSGYGDMRNGSVTSEYVDYGEWGWYQTVYKSASGVSYGSFYDDGCNWGCRGVSPNLDVSAYFRKGSNSITLVCANANRIGPCYATISVTVQKTVVTGSAVVNGCAALEVRAQ